MYLRWVPIGKAGPATHHCNPRAAGVDGAKGGDITIIDASDEWLIENSGNGGPAGDGDPPGERGAEGILSPNPNTVHLRILTWILGRPVRPWMRLRTGKLLIFLFTALGLQRPRLEDTRSFKISSKTVS